MCCSEPPGFSADVPGYLWLPHCHGVIYGGTRQEIRLFALMRERDEKPSLFLSIVWWLILLLVSSVVKLFHRWEKGQNGFCFLGYSFAFFYDDRILTEQDNATAVTEKPAALVTCQSDSSICGNTIAHLYLFHPTWSGLAAVDYGFGFPSPSVTPHCTGENASCPYLCQ